MPGFFVDQERVESAKYFIDTTGDRAEELEPTLWRILDMIMEREKRMFETRGATSGVYWAPLRGTTVYRKEKLGVDHILDPLRRFGALEKSLTVQGAEFQHLSVDDSGLELRTDAPGASYHVTGTSRMPPRPPLIIPAKHARQYTQMLNDFIFGSDG